MVLTILWQVYMFLLAYEPIQAYQLMEELFGRVNQGFWTFIGFNFKWKHEHKQWRRGKQRQSSFALFKHFPKSIFYMLYTISKIKKSRIQCFKRCAIRSWNEGVKAIRSWSLQAEGRFLHGCEISLLLREFRSHFEQCTGVLLKLPDSCNRHFWIFFFRYFCINFHSSPCNPPTIRFLG